MQVPQGNLLHFMYVHVSRGNVYACEFPRARTNPDPAQVRCVLRWVKTVTAMLFSFTASVRAFESVMYKDAQCLGRR